MSKTKVGLDSLGNILRVSNTYDDCPYPCAMTLPHKHSLIPAETAWHQRSYRQGFIDAVKMVEQDGLAPCRYAATAMQRYQ